jgi:hypothetical protein
MFLSSHARGTHTQLHTDIYRPARSATIYNRTLPPNTTTKHSLPPNTHYHHTLASLPHSFSTLDLHYTHNTTTTTNINAYANTNTYTYTQSHTSIDVPSPFTNFRQDETYTMWLKVTSPHYAPLLAQNTVVVESISYRQ